MSELFPWTRLMRLGLGELRLKPEDFWSMTLRELHAAVAPPPALRRADLDALAERFPDE